MRKFWKIGSLSAIAFLCISLNNYHNLNRYQLSGFAQGTTWQISYYSTSSLIAKSSLDSIFNVINNSMSLYEPNSLINRFNRSEKGDKIDSHLKAVINKSLTIYRESNRVFDITVKPLVQVWGFGPKKTNVFPDSAHIQDILHCIGSDKIIIKNDSLLKQKNCVEIDVNGIAQGYTVDVIAEFLESKKVVNYVIELGGEIRVKGSKPQGEKFKVGIEAPNAFPTLRKIIAMQEGAITTSGNYSQYRLQGNKKISHLINSKSGYPVHNEMISVTVWAKNAITSDGFDNVFMNLGIKESLLYLKNKKDLAAYFIYLKEDSTVADTASAGFNRLFDN